MSDIGCGMPLLIERNSVVTEETVEMAFGWVKCGEPSEGPYLCPECEQAVEQLRQLLAAADDMPRVFGYPEEQAP